MLRFLKKIARALFPRYREEIANLGIRLVLANLDKENLRDQIRVLQDALVVAVDRLELIAEQQTPSANSTVTRMANLSREAVKEIAEATSWLPVLEDEPKKEGDQ